MELQWDSIAPEGWRDIRLGLRMLLILASFHPV